MGEFCFRELKVVTLSSSKMSKRNGLTLDLKPAAPAGASAGGGTGGGATFTPVSGIAPSKKARLKTAPEILTSPDVQMLKLTSPQLAEFLTRNPSLASPTPSGNTILFPKNVTEEQELYAKGFEVALKNMHQGTGSGPGGATISTSTGLTISTQPPPPPLVMYKTEPSNSSNASAIEA